MTTHPSGATRTSVGRDAHRASWPAPESLVLFLIIVITLIAASVSGLLMGAAS